jgi:hypothetical protein
MSGGWRPAMLLLALGLTALLPAALAQAATATEIIEKESGQHFRSPLKQGRSSYTLVGTAVAKSVAGPDYAMALYVEESARQSFPAVYDRVNRKHAGLFLENRAQNFYIWGHFDKLALLRFLRPVPRDQLQKIFRDGLADLLGPAAAADLRKDALALLAIFDTDVASGQEVRIHTDDSGQIQVFFGAEFKSGPQSPKLCRHLWDIWLGYHGAAQATRNALLDRIDILAK